MNQISKHMFENIRRDILERQPADFSSLCIAAEAVLLPYIKNILYTKKSDPALAEDIMQDVHIKLLKTVVTHFFLREDGEKDETALMKWMYVVAKNATLTTLKRAGKNMHLPLEYENDEGDTVPVPVTEKRIDTQPGRMMELRNEIKQCLSFILDFGSEAHITLSCLMINLLMLELGSDRIEAKRQFTEMFSEKTLDDILSTFRTYTCGNSWLGITEQQVKNCERKLEKPFKGIRTGSLPMKAFAMKKGLENSLSDWLNRMDERLSETFGEEHLSNSDDGFQCLMLIA